MNESQLESGPTIGSLKERKERLGCGSRRGSGAAALVLVAISTAMGSAGAAFAAGGEPRSDAEILKETLFQGLNLLILLGVIFYFARRPVQEFFAVRRAGIESELSQAAELLARAEQRNSELQRRLVDLSSEIEEIGETASRRADDEAERILAEARAAADRIRRDARAAMDQELRRAKAELRAEAADLALELAARKLSEAVTDSDRERLMDEFITRVESSGAPTSGALPRGAES